MPPFFSKHMKIVSPSSTSTGSRYVRPLILGGLIVVAYFAAINRTQPLLWGIAALLSATLLTGLFWPHWLVKRLSVTRTGPARAAEGERITFHVEVRNHGWLPRFMVELVDHLPFVGSDNAANGRGEHALGMVGHIPGGAVRGFDVTLVCEKRGFYRLGPVSLASSFPLEIAHARRRCNDDTHTLTVYPDVFPIAALPLAGVASQIHRGAYLLPQGTGTTEFSGLREYLRGDNPRHIHWPTTARLNQLMVKEFEPLASASLCIALDLAADANVGQGRHATLEYAIRIAASMAGFSCPNGIPTQLRGHTDQSLMVAAGSGEHHYQRILDELAVLDSRGTVPYATVLEQAALDCQPGQTVAIFLSEPAERIAGTLHALALLRAKGANLLIVDFQRASFAADHTLAARRLKHDKRANALSGLPELGAHYLQVSCGDDLTQLFNP